jgi:hypothetical protein
MSAPSTAPAGFALTLTEEERTLLLNLLGQALRDTRIEAHRTDAPDYREHINRREAVYQGLFDRLRRP